MISFIDTAVLAGYFLVMLLIGFYFARRQKGTETYFLANRSLKTFHATGAIFSTFVGAGLLFTMASFGYLYGFSALLLLLPVLVGFTLFSFVAPRLKRISDQIRAITLPEVMQRHWSRRTRLLAALLTMSLFAAPLAVNFLVAGNILMIAFDVSLAVGITLFAVLVIAYTLLGGFLSVTWTDIFQFFLMFLATLFVLLPFTLSKFGGLDAAYTALTQAEFQTMPLALSMGLFIVAILALFGSQDIFQRVYAATDKRRPGGRFVGLPGFSWFWAEV